MIVTFVIFFRLYSANFRGKTRSEEYYLTAGTLFIPSSLALWLHRWRIVFACPWSRQWMQREMSRKRRIGNSNA